MAYKRTWTGRLKSFGWTRARGAQPLDHLVLTVELTRESGRYVEVLVARDQALGLVAWVQQREAIERAEHARYGDGEVVVAELDREG